MAGSAVTAYGRLHRGIAWLARLVDRAVTARRLLDGSGMRRMTWCFVLGVAACGEPDTPSLQPDPMTPDAGGVDASASPGDVLWSYSYALQVQFAPAIAEDGTIVAQGTRTLHTPAGGPTVVAVSPTGELRWDAVSAPGATPAPPPAIDDGVVLVPAAKQGAVDGVLYRYQLEGGTALPPIDLTGPIMDGLAVGSDGTIYIPATPLQAVRDGAPVWSYLMTGDGKTGTNAAVGPSGTIYVAGRGADHNLHAINPDGSEKWTRDLGAATIDPLAVDDAERIYVVTSGGKLFVYDVEGELAWTYQLPSNRSGGGMVIGPDRTVYVGAAGTTPGAYTGEYLFALREGEAGKGEVVWRKLVGLSWITATPALSANGTLYVSDFCRTIAAVRASDGEELWSYAVPGAVETDTCALFSAPAIGADGTVYAWTEGLPSGEGGGLYAFHGDGSGPAAAAWVQEGADAAHRGRVE